MFANFFTFWSNFIKGIPVYLVVAFLVLAFIVLLFKTFRSEE